MSDNMCENMCDAEKESARYYEILASEERHRTLNFLNLLSSVIKLKAGSYESEEIRNFRDEIISLIESTSGVYTLITTAGTETLSTDTFFLNITNSLNHFPHVREKKVKIKQVIQTLRLPGEYLLPLSLITIESFTNSLKYAFPPDREGPHCFHIEFSHNNESACLALRDNGIGPGTGGIRSEEHPGSGITIMESLAGQLKGEIDLREEEGTLVELNFPISTASRSSD